MFQNLIGKSIFVSLGKVFTSYLCTKLHPYLQKKQNRLRSPKSVEIPVARAPQKNRKWFWYFLSIGISVSAIIKIVSYAITTFLGPEPIKLPYIYDIQ